MSTTTELFGESLPWIRHVPSRRLLTEQSHCSGFLRFFHIHDICFNIKTCLDLFCLQAPLLLQFFCCHSLRNEQSQNEVCPELPENLLLYVGTKNGFQCFLQKMCCTVVFLGIFSLLLRSPSGILSHLGNHTGFHMSNVTEFAAAEFDGVLLLQIYRLHLRSHRYHLPVHPLLHRKESALQIRFPSGLPSESSTISFLW